MSTLRWDETWHRLREWTAGQAPSERLSAQLLLADGFSNLDPSHPLGGKDGGKDAFCTRQNQLWVMAAYFPRGQQTFAHIMNKFNSDLIAAQANNIHGFAFVTNQELTLCERKELVSQSTPTVVDIYHLERITALLDSERLAQTRKQFLGIDYVNPSVGDHFEILRNEIRTNQMHLESLQTGGNAFCYFMLYDFDLHQSIARNFVIIRKGEYPLYDVRLRIRDMETSRDIFTRPWGEISAPAEFLLLRWSLAPSIYYRVFFSARNGAWHQDLILRRSEISRCWLAATRVRGGNGRDELFSYTDNGYVSEFGEAKWRS